jgi:hypothetical protein
MIHRYTHPETGGYIDVLQRPQGPASVLGLEVPEEHRGKGIGQMLQAEALERHPALMGQVSSKAAATTAYRLGRRPYGAPDATLDDVFSTIDSDSSVNMLSPQAQPKADGGSVSAKENFLAGNHPLVPDELYHGNAPKIVEKQNYQGDGKWTSEVDQEATDRNIAAQDFRAFKPSQYGNYGPGIYLSDSPKTASSYAQGIRADQPEVRPYGQVMKLHVSMKQPFTDDVLRHPAWVDYIKNVFNKYNLPQNEREQARAVMKKLDDGTATMRDVFLSDTPHGTMVNQWGHHELHDTIRNSGFDGIIANRDDGTKEYVAFKPEQVKSAISATKFDPTDPDITKADGGEVSAPQKTVKAYKLFRTKGDGNLYPLFVNAEKPVPMGEWLEAEEGPQGKAQGKVKSKLGDLAYRPGWHAGDLPMATHIGGKSDPSLKKPDYRPDNHVWAEVEMAADKDWQSVADSRGKGVKAHITDQVPFGGFYRYKTNPNMTGNC